MDRLPIDIFIVLLGEMSLQNVYALKVVSKTMLSVIKSSTASIRYHKDIFWGVSAKNVRLICRDMASLSDTPTLNGKMNKSTFEIFKNTFQPSYMVVSSYTATSRLYTSIIENTPECIQCLRIVVGQRNVRQIRRMKKPVKSMHIETKDGITLDLVLDLLHISQCSSVSEMKLVGTLNKMSEIYYHLPSNISKLYIYTENGVHETLSLKFLLELGLDDLILTNCYSICSNTDCINYHYIASRIRDARILPKRLALSPFPVLGMKIALSRSCNVNFDESNYFEHEMSEISELLKFI